MTATAKATTDSASRSSSQNISGGWRVAFWFLLPSLIGFVVFFLYPTLRGVYLAFTDWNLLANEGEWIGFDNFERMRDDKALRNSLWVTLKYVIFNIGSQTVVSIVIAVMMDRLTKSQFVRSILLLPWLMPNVVVALLWVWMLDANLGIVNTMLGWIGIDGINFFTSTSWVIPTIAAVNTWKFMGYTALLIFAGLQTIPGSLYEAGAIDGATEVQMFRRITLPLLRPVLALVLVITIVGSMQVFDVVNVATGGFGGQAGGPVNASRVVYLYIYQTTMTFFEPGYAAAMSLLLVAILMVVTFLQLKLLRAVEIDLA